jgi:long-chain acyl-CoA synthetase
MATQAERSAHHRALDQGTAPGVFQFTAKRVPDRLALKTLDGSLELTWREYEELVRKTAAGLAALGLQKGDTIAIMLVNRPEFHIVDSAAMHLGATPFSIYNTYTATRSPFWSRMRRRRSR